MYAFSKYEYNTVLIRVHMWRLHLAVNKMDLTTLLWKTMYNFTYYFNFNYLLHIFLPFS